MSPGSFNQPYMKFPSSFHMRTFESVGEPLAWWEWCRVKAGGDLEVMARSRLPAATLWDRIVVLAEKNSRVEPEDPQEGRTALYYLTFLLGIAILSLSRKTGVRSRYSDAPQKQHVSLPHEDLPWE